MTDTRPGFKLGKAIGFVRSTLLTFSPAIPFAFPEYARPYVVAVLIALNITFVNLVAALEVKP